MKRVTTHRFTEIQNQEPLFPFKVQVFGFNTSRHTATEIYLFYQVTKITHSLRIRIGLN